MIHDTLLEEQTNGNRTKYNLAFISKAIAHIRMTAKIMDTILVGTHAIALHYSWVDLLLPCSAL